MNSIDKKIAHAIADFVKGYMELHTIRQKPFTSSLLAPPVIAFPDESDYDEKVNIVLQQRIHPVNKLALQEAYKQRKIILAFTLPSKPKKTGKRKRK